MGELIAIAPGESPEDAAEGFAFEGLDESSLAALGALLGAPPAPLREALAEIPALEEEDFDALAARWRVAFPGGNAEDVAFLLQQAGELARSALLQGKTLRLRRSSLPSS